MRCIRGDLNELHLYKISRTEGVSTWSQSRPPTLCMKVFTVSGAPSEDGDQSRLTASSSREATLNLIALCILASSGYKKFTVAPELPNKQSTTFLSVECHRRSDSEAGLTRPEDSHEHPHRLNPAQG